MHDRYDVNPPLVLRICSLTTKEAGAFIDDGPLPRSRHRLQLRIRKTPTTPVPTASSAAGTSAARDVWSPIWGTVVVAAVVAFVVVPPGTTGLVVGWSLVKVAAVTVVPVKSVSRLIDLGWTVLFVPDANTICGLSEP